MTLDGLMDVIKTTFMRVASGPLRDRAWRTLAVELRRELGSYLRSNPRAERMDYSFHLVVDTDGGVEFNRRSIADARRSWARALSVEPEKTLEISGSVRRRGSTRATVEIVARASTLTRTEIRRGSSASPSGERVREEGGRASVRGGTGSIDRERLAALSGEPPGTPRTATAAVPEDDAGGGR